MPSFLSSTLSQAFLICVLATIVMIFQWVSPNQVTFGVITAVVAAYLARYWTPKPPEWPTDTTTITTSTSTPKEEIQSIHNLPDNWQLEW